MSRQVSDVRCTQRRHVPELSRIGLARGAHQAKPMMGVLPWLMSALRRISSEPMPVSSAVARSTSECLSLR